MKALVIESRRFVKLFYVRTVYLLIKSRCKRNFSNLQRAGKKRLQCHRLKVKIPPLERGGQGEILQPSDATRNFLKSTTLTPAPYNEYIFSKPSCLSVAERRVDHLWLLSVSVFCAMFIKIGCNRLFNVFDFWNLQSKSFLRGGSMPLT